MSLKIQVKPDSDSVQVLDGKVVALKRVLEDSTTSFKPPVKKAANFYDDVDDMWDNVPV